MTELINSIDSFAGSPSFQGFLHVLKTAMELLTLHNLLTVASYTFFFVTLAVFLWQVYRYVGFVKEAVSLKKVGFRVIIQSFFTLYFVIVALLSAGINGFAGIFWVFSFIGFSLTLIFFIDRAAKRDKRVSN